MRGKNPPRHIWDPQLKGPFEPPVQYEEALRISREHYAKYNAEELEQRIKEFYKHDWDSPDFDIVKAVNDVLRPPDITSYVFPLSWDEIPAGNILWRARSMGAEQLLNGITPSDLWEPPADFASIGRLNAENEPLLYTCLGNPTAPLQEARITEPETGFILVGYRVVESIFVKRVGLTNSNPDLTPEEQRIERMLSKFVAEVFATPESYGGISTYNNTRKLLRTLYQLEPGWESGWIYASTIVGPNSANVALEPQDAHKRLTIRCVVAGQVLVTASDHYTLRWVGFSDGKPKFGEKISWQYFPPTGLESIEDSLKYLEEYL